MSTTNNNNRESKINILVNSLIILKLKTMTYLKKGNLKKMSKNYL